MAKAWTASCKLGGVMDGPMAVLILSKGTFMQIVLGPVLTRNGGYAFDCWSPEEGLSRGYIYGRIEDAHYARNIEIRSCNTGTDQTIACSTVDDFARLTLDPRGRQRRALATPLPNADEKRVVIEAVCG
jgi:hypothetical protein